MTRFLTLLHTITQRSARQSVLPGVGQPGIGFVLVVLFSMVFAMAAHAQTDNGESSSSEVPTLTIASSHTIAVKGEEVTFTITADSAPTTDILVYVQVQVTVREQSFYQSKVMTVSLGAGERTLELLADTGGGGVGAGILTLDVSILGGAGYRLGDSPVVGIRVTDPPAEAATGSGGAGQTPPPAPVGFTASAAAEDSIAVSWDDLAGVSHYRLEEQLGSSSVVMWRVVRELGSIAQTSATVDGLASGTTYQYRVRGVRRWDGQCGSVGRPIVERKRHDPGIADAGANCQVSGSARRAASALWVQRHCPELLHHQRELEHRDWGQLLSVWHLAGQSWGLDIRQRERYKLFAD